ncbi:uncharacterized protein JCM10292_000962 [Rhodotorula paludigena]|uniref:uncharacterized protein n=1 Tax=Rhodotorula paludigena TaxID=86838 RepID=UPI00316D68F5
MATPSHRDALRSTKSHSSSSGSGTFRPFDSSTGSDAASFISTAPSTLLPTYAYARADPPPLPLEQGFIPPPLDLDDEERLILGTLPIFARGAGTAMAEYGWTRAEEELEVRGGSERRDKCSLGRSTPGLERPMSPASVLLAPIPRPAVPVPRLEQALPSVPVDPSRSSKRASVFATLAAPFAVLSRSRSTGGLAVPGASDDARRGHRLSMIGEMDSSSPSPASSISRSSSSASGQESRLRTRSTLFGTLTSRPLSRVTDPALSASTSAPSPAALTHASPPTIPHVRFARTPPELAALSCGTPIAEDEVSEKAARLLGLPSSSSPSSHASPIPTAAPSPPPALHGTGPTEAQRRYARASRRAAALLGLRGTSSFQAQEVEVEDRKQGAAGHSFFDADSSDDESPVVRVSSRFLPLSAASNSAILASAL